MLSPVCQIHMSEGCIFVFFYPFSHLFVLMFISAVHQDEINMSDLLNNKNGSRNGLKSNISICFIK